MPLPLRQRIHSDGRQAFDVGGDAALDEGLEAAKFLFPVRFAEAVARAKYDGVTFRLHAHQFGGGRRGDLTVRHPPVRVLGTEGVNDHLSPQVLLFDLALAVRGDLIKDADLLVV